MKRTQQTLDFLINLWATFPTWLKATIIISLVIIMGQNGIFDKPY
jgi:uncharacterized protein (DUF983 family)